MNWYIVLLLIVAILLLAFLWFLVRIARELHKTIKAKEED